jgi:glycyl-tRNA synthetase
MYPLFNLCCFLFPANFRTFAPLLSNAVFCTKTLKHKNTKTLNTLMQEELFKRLVSHCKEYGFIYASSEVYDGLGGIYDYGPMGAELKNNIKQYWWKAMVQLHENIVGLDSAIFMHPKIWKASGHVDAFNDPLIDNKDSKKRYRADQLIEGEIDKLEAKIEKEVEKARKKFDNFDEAMFRSTNQRVVDWAQRADAIARRLAEAMRTNDLAGIKTLIEELEIADPESGSRNWTDVRQFNLMFSTQMSNIASEEGKLYLRPETAQGIFVNFLNVQKTTRQKLPFGIAQIGKAFRNEIVARQFIFRMREFEQMEMQYFVRPEEAATAYEEWRAKRFQYYIDLGIKPENLRWHQHENLVFYAKAAWDIEYNFPFGFKELEGVHNRSDYDLTQHSKFSGEDLSYRDPQTNEKFTPWIVETSVGLDRTFLAVLTDAYTEEPVQTTASNEPGEEVGDQEIRVVLKFPKKLAPVQVAVFPLMKNKPELVEKAREIFATLKKDFRCEFDDNGNVGKRYRRQDEIGTPYCVTVDFDTLTDGAVTVRDRDTMQQERVKIEELHKYLS